ncbi:hypothetical protein [Nocardiopsis tropica]|uniref:Scaffolding protein n=1 Tax=Nocardiopsis tropica TaxID=109330 RepID=A0ABU7KQV7_9ACTN|nr:hypothetical protein [Nocardiopsis umidischolae]MEE2051691.1 hypothetical protein [Nocardiopsis umidischolae]
MHLPSAPGALIGYRKNGRPIYLMAGGSGEGDPAPEVAPPTPESPKPTPPPDEAKPAVEEKPKAVDADPWADPETARKEIEKLRRENASSRTNAKQQAAQEAIDELTGKLGRALGYVKDDQPPTAEELTKQLTEAAKERDATQSELQQLRVERAAERAAREHGADVDVLLDSRSFATKLADLDPSATDFSDTVNALVEKAVADNPKFKVAQAAASSSADFSGGPGEQRNTRPSGLHAAFRNHFGG